MKKTLILSITLLAVGAIYGLNAWFKPLTELSRSGSASRITRPSVVTTETLRTGQAAVMKPTLTPPNTGDTASGAPSAALETPSNRRSFEDPEALMEFADYLEPKLDIAEENIQVARDLFTELETCVTSAEQKGGIAVQAMCMSGAEELADMHGELTGKFDDLKKRASPSVMSLLDGEDDQEVIE